MPRAQAAVDARLGKVEVAGAEGWRARYTVGHAPERTSKDFVRLELYDPKGRLQLERDLPMEDSCAIMADVIALVLDRYFRDLGHQTLDGNSQSESSDVSGREVAEKADEPTAAAPSQRALDGDAGASTLVGIEFGGTTLYGPLAGVRLTQRLTSHTLLTVAVLSPFSEREQLLSGGARATARALEVRSSFNFGLRFAGVRPYFGPAVVGFLERGATSGLARPQGGTRGLLGLGIDAGVIFPIGPHAALTLASGVVALLPPSRRFQVDAQEVLIPPDFVGFLAAGVAYAF